MPEAVKPHHPPYRIENGVTLIEIYLETLAQLFNSLDPSPFHRRDLDSDAEDFIAGAIAELPLETPVKLIVHLPAQEAARADGGELQASVRNYFAYRASGAARDLRLEMRRGRVTLAIGLAFLVLCVGARQLVYSLGTGTIQQLVAEGLLISGWVAMWRPIQIYLYDWWPIRRRKRELDKLAAIELAIQPYTAPPPLSPASG